MWIECPKRPGDCRGCFLPLTTQKQDLTPMNEMNTPAPSPYAVATLNQWRSEVAKMTDADALDRGLAFLDSYRTYTNRHPFRGDDLDHAKAILHKHGKTLNVTRYAQGYRDNEPSK